MSGGTSEHDQEYERRRWQYRLYRWQRINAMWERFVALKAAGGGRAPVAETVPRRQASLRAALLGCRPAGWRFPNSLAAADLGFEPDELRPPERPTGHRRGTAGKLEVLAARAAAGEELWHPEDAGMPADVTVTM